MVTKDGSDGEIHMKPAVLWGFILLVSGGNFLYTQKETGAAVEAAFSASEGAALRAQINELQGKIEMLQHGGPTEVRKQIEKVQASVDSCMQCHLRMKGHESLQKYRDQQQTLPK